MHEFRSTLDEHWQMFAPLHPSTLFHMYLAAHYPYRNAATVEKMLLKLKPWWEYQSSLFSTNEGKQMVDRLHASLRPSSAPTVFTVNHSMPSRLGNMQKLCILLCAPLTAEELATSALCTALSLKDGKRKAGCTTSLNNVSVSSFCNIGPHLSALEVVCNNQSPETLPIIRTTSAAIVYFRSRSSPARCPVHKEASQYARCCIAA